MGRYSWIALTMATYASTAYGEPESYLCIPLLSVGTHYDEQSKSWMPRRFAASEHYVMRPIKYTDPILGGRSSIPESTCGPEEKKCDGEVLGVFEVGQKIPIAVCATSDFWGDGKHIEYLCRVGLAQFDFDRESGRFQLYRKGGYLRMDDKNTDSAGNKLSLDDVFIEVGKCEPF